MMNDHKIPNHNTPMGTIKKIEYLPVPVEGYRAERPPSYPPIIVPIRFLFGTLGYLMPELSAKVAYRLFSTPRVRARHKVSDPLLESARIFEFMYGKQLLKGYEWGYGGRTVLLVHGWESRGTALRTFVPPLLEKGFRVVAFDGPAHGNSGGRRTNLIHFGGAVRAILNQIGGAYGIITHSFGGASTVFALSSLQPSLSAEKLVLIGVPNRIEKVLRDAIATLNVPPPAARRFLRHMEKKVNAPLHHISLSHTGKHIKVKQALIVHDKQDQVVPLSEAQAIFDSWNNASLLISDGLGHYRLMKDPSLVQRVADFMG
jgi:pimeloyl-ACP methyl ester carboxylesterase